MARAMPRATAHRTLKAAVLVRAPNSEGKREPHWKQCGFFCSQELLFLSAARADADSDQGQYR
jgi:hypothetical protein